MPLFALTLLLTAVTCSTCISSFSCFCFFCMHVYRRTKIQIPQLKRGDVISYAPSGQDSSLGAIVRPTRDSMAPSQESDFKFGPLFDNILIFHNLHLAPAETQTFLVQMMRVKLISVFSKPYTLPEIQCVLATHRCSRKLAYYMSRPLVCGS